MMPWKRMLRRIFWVGMPHTAMHTVAALWPARCAWLRCSIIAWLCTRRTCHTGPYPLRLQPVLHRHSSFKASC